MIAKNYSLYDPTAPKRESQKSLLTLNKTSKVHCAPLQHRGENTDDCRPSERLKESILFQSAPLQRQG